MNSNINEIPICTHCGAPLIARTCKLRCARCGYFEDCSDTGLPVPLDREAPSIAHQEKPFSPTK